MGVVVVLVQVVGSLGGLLIESLLIFHDAFHCFQVFCVHLVMIPMHFSKEWA